MEKKVWFKRKLFGWGWSPCSWEGWFVTFVFVLFVLSLSITIDESSTAKEVFFIFILPVMLATITFVRIAYKKGEKPCWQWGKRREDLD